MLCQNYIEAERFRKRNLCAECGDEPQLYPNREGGYDVRCQNRNHKGFTKLKSYTQIWREGQAVPLIIANKIQKKYGGDRMDSTTLAKASRTEMERRLNLAMKSFGFVVEETGLSRAPNLNEVKLLVDYCLTYAFDPLLNEVCLYQGRPYPMIDGLRRKAQETEKYRGLKMEPVLDPATKVALGYKEQDIVFKATVRKAENGEIAEFERYGGVTQQEINEMSKRDPTKHRHPVVYKNPSDSAQNRAERDALRAAFQFNFPGVQGLPVVIEGEWGGKGGEKAAKGQPPPPSPIKGGGFPKPENVKNWDQTTNYAKHFFDLEESDCLKICGKTHKSQIADAGEAWRLILEAKVPKQGEREEVKTSE